MHEKSGFRKLTVACRVVSSLSVHSDTLATLGLRSYGSPPLQCDLGKEERDGPAQPAIGNGVDSTGQVEGIHDLDQTEDDKTESNYIAADHPLAVNSKLTVEGS